MGGHAGDQFITGDDHRLVAASHLSAEVGARHDVTMVVPPARQEQDLRAARRCPGHPIPGDDHVRRRRSSMTRSPHSGLRDRIAGLVEPGGFIEGVRRYAPAHRARQKYPSEVVPRMDHAATTCPPFHVSPRQRSSHPDRFDHTVALCGASPSNWARRPTATLRPSCGSRWATAAGDASLPSGPPDATRHEARGIRRQPAGRTAQQYRIAGARTYRPHRERVRRRGQAATASRMRSTLIHTLPILELPLPSGIRAAGIFADIRFTRDV